jgi:hypothetical protein
MENKTTVPAKGASTAGGGTLAAPNNVAFTATKEVAQPKIIEQKYHLVANERKGGYHPLPAKLRAESTTAGSISSEFVNSTGAIIRGLSTDQERYFASKLINKNPKDFGYDEAMTTFWADYTISIPRVDGLRLNASYKLEEVKVDNELVTIEIPVNLHDYIKANFARQSSRVAFLEDQKASSDLFDFIMNDLSVEKRIEDAAFKTKLEATKAYTDLISSSSEKDHSKIDWLLDLLKEPNELFYTADYITKCKRLDQLKDAKSTEFIALYNDRNLETKSLLFRLKQSGIVTVQGKSIFFGDELIGAGDEDANVFLNDQTKSGTVVKMKAQLSEITKVRV